MALVVRRADISLIAGIPGLVDLRLEGGRIAAVAPALAAGEDETIDAGGAPVLPGLHDHHVHLRALAAAQASVTVGPPEVGDASGLERRLRQAAAAVPPGGWVRAVGYHESVAGDLDRWALDRLCATHPVRVQHASGGLWVLNSAALEVLVVDGDAPPGVERDGAGTVTGRIWREDAWLATRLPRTSGDLHALSAEAARRGVTGFTDATPGRRELDADGLATAAAGGTIVQRVHAMAEPGATVEAGPGTVTLGPVKVMLDDVGLPTLDGLTSAVDAAHRSGRPVAVHCVTRVQGVLAVTAFAGAGTMPGDRIEHGAILGADLLPTIARLGLTVVTQPGMAMGRGDRYLSDVEPDEVPDLWRAASLEKAGIAVAGGTDAPYGPADPWRSVVAAVARRTPGGAVLGEAERFTLVRAVRLFTGWPERPSVSRRLAPGEPADLCVLAGPLPAVLSDPPAVAATIVAGDVVYRADDAG